MVEVLSETTSRTDLGPKVIEYGALSGVDVYVIVAQNEPLVKVWRRNADGHWPKAPDTLDGLDASVGLPGLGIVLPLAEIYRRVPLG